jgi:peptide/nickel transport system substrate-binding protein
MALTRRQWVLSAAGAAGCSRHRRRGREANSITVLYPHDEFALGPDGWQARFLVFLPLVAWNRRGELEGRLAETWEHSPDYRNWTIRLRDKVRWHDGAPVTAYDVKFTMDLFSHPDAMVFAPGSYQVRVIDDLTYSLTCNSDVSWGTPLDEWTVYYPKHLLEKLSPKEFWAWDFWKRPVGNGPYRHVRTVPQTMMQVAANPDYYRGKPSIAKVILKFGDNTSALQELFSGGVEAATDIRRADVSKLERDGRFGLYHQPFDDEISVILWNQRLACFRDANVRRALTMAIDRRELCQVLNFPSETPLIDAPCSRRQFRLRDLPSPIPYDRDAAGQLLDQACWRRNRQGVRERYGKPFRFAAITGKILDLDEAAVYVQAQLRHLGIEMEIRVLDSSLLFQRAVTGDYEAAFAKLLTGWGPGNGPENILSATGYANPRFHQLANRLRTPLEPEHEEQAYAELAQLLKKDAPATFLYPRVYTTVADRHVRGLERTAYPGDLTGCMDDLSWEAAS